MKEKKRILICDDDESILEVATLILTENEHVVETCSRDVCIMQKIEQFLPHIVLLDIWMADKDTTYLIKQIKSKYKQNGLKLYVFSALNDLSSLSSKSGADGYLAKPFSLNDLMNIIDS